MPFEPVFTADGSLSCLDSETGQLCHNRAGAYTESVHLYAKPSGLIQKLQKQRNIRVLDACYGLGYNTWALFNELIQSIPLSSEADDPHHEPLTVSVVAIEKAAEILQFLPRILEHPTFDPLKQKIDSSEHNTYYRTLMCSSDNKGGKKEPLKSIINVVDWGRLELELWIADLREIAPTLSGEFDAVFHDPFSPQKMPELWTVDLFREYRRLLQARQGCLLTYSEAAAVRGGLEEAGFEVLKTEGLGAKTGGTFAGISDAQMPEARLSEFQAPAGAGEARSSHQELSRHEQTENRMRSGIFPLDAWERAYLGSRAGIPYRDEGLSQERSTILERRMEEQAQSSRLPGGPILRQKPRLGV